MQNTYGCRRRKENHVWANNVPKPFSYIDMRCMTPSLGCVLPQVGPEETHLIAMRKQAVCDGSSGEMLLLPINNSCN